MTINIAVCIKQVPNTNQVKIDKKTGTLIRKGIKSICNPDDKNALEEALRYSKTFPEKVFVCGGQSIYEESIRYADYMYLSFIKGEHQGNVYFPEFDEGEWTIERKEEHDEFVFVVYRNKRRS